MSAFVEKFAGRKPALGIAYAISKDKLALADPTGQRLGVNERSMSATYVVTEEVPDRVGDVVSVEGIYLENFRRNPIAFYNHQSVPTFALPIGKWEDPNGNMTIRKEPKRAIGTLYFSQKNREALQVFELTVEGILRACSIGFNPLQEPILRSDREPNPNSIERGYFFPRTDLLEVSPVGTPCAPTATLVRSYLSAGRIAGEPISDMLRKSLEPLAEPAPVWSPGGWEGTAVKAFDPNEKPADCICPGYPRHKLRNGSGHRPECPEHKRWLDRGGFHQGAKSFFDSPRFAPAPSFWAQQSTTKAGSFFGECERDELGHCKPGGGGGDKPSAGPEIPADDEVHSYLEGFNDPGQEPATADDANAANEELAESGSNYRIVPDGKGGWTAAGAEDLEGDYGEDWTVAVNPLTGKAEVGDAAFFADTASEAGDETSASYVQAFNQAHAAGEAITDEEVARANQEMADDGSGYRIEFDADNDYWHAVHAGEADEGEEDEDEDGDEEKSFSPARPKWFPARGAKTLVRRERNKPMSKKWTKGQSRRRAAKGKDMGESSAVAAGATVPPEAAETGGQRKSMVKAVMSHHKADAHPEGPHDAYLHEEKGLVYHHHHKDADPEHLAVVKSDLGKIEGVVGVGQGPEPLAEDGYQRVFPEEPAREDANTGTETPAAQAGEQKHAESRAKQLAFHAARAKGYKVALKHLPAEKRKAVEDCVHRKIPKLIDEGYEQTQAEAIAFSTCGEKAFGDEEYEQKDDEALDGQIETNPESAIETEDVTDEKRPPSLNVCQRAIEFLETELPGLEPEDREFIQEEIDRFREWGQRKHPDEDFGGADTDPDERDPANQAAEQEETEEALAPYKRGQARRRKAILAARKKAAPQLGTEHSDILKAVADHLHAHAKMVGKMVTQKHADDHTEHGRNVDILRGALTKDAAGDVDVTEGETPPDNKDVTEGKAPAAETEEARADEHDEAETKDFWGMVVKAAKPVAERQTRIDDAIYRITGKR